MLYFLPSPLFAYHLSTWAESWGPGCHGIILELEPNLQDYTAPLPGGKFTRFTEFSEECITSFFLRHPPGSFRKVRMITLTAGTTLHREKYQAVNERLEAEITHHWQNRSTLMVMAPLYLKNLWRNLRILADRPLGGLPAGLPGPLVVLGAGQSLEALLPELKMHRERLFLVAADTALPALRDAEIYPDAVTVLESQYHNLADFQGYPWGKTELWADLTAHPKTFRLPWKSLRVFLSRFSSAALIERLGALGVPLVPPRGSVGITALELALGATEGPVGLAGLDFSFRPGKSHTRGAPALTRRLILSERLVSLESPPEAGLVPLSGKDGGEDCKIVTTKVLRSYGHSAAGLLEPHRHRVWDLRAGGMELGMTRGTLADLWESHRLGREEAPPGRMGETIAPLPCAALLKREISLLNQLWVDFETLNRTGSLPQDFDKRLGKVDYLWVAFPDADHLDPMSPSSLARIKASLAFHWRYLTEPRY